METIVIAINVIILLGNNTSISVYDACLVCGVHVAPTASEMLISKTAGVQLVLRQRKHFPPCYLQSHLKRFLLDIKSTNVPVVIATPCVPCTLDVAVYHT